MSAIEGERGRSCGIIYKSQYVKHSEGSGGNRFDHLNTTWKENNASLCWIFCSLQLKPANFSFESWKLIEKNPYIIIIIYNN
jgi:hypothetical protein